MTLGERIQQVRKRHGLSQEALAEKLDVSRQAVSKWETGLSNPDTQNLILLAELFEISVDELVGAKHQKASGQYIKPERANKKNTRIVSRIAVVMLLIIIGTRIWSNIHERRAADRRAAMMGGKLPGEYALCWYKDSSHRVETVSSSWKQKVYTLLGSNPRQQLEIGIQDGSFPWNTSLTGKDTSYTSGDMPGVEFHTVECADIVIFYNRNIETGEEFITSMQTVSPNYATARDIRPGDTEMELVAAYDDELLVMPEIYSSKDDFCMYNSLYAFSEEDDGYNFVVFYVLDGQITGIKVRLADDGGPAYFVDNIHTFHLVNGKPDYSQKQEPDLETLSKERKVYVALHTLLNHSLTEQDAFPHRNTIFAGLRYIDWMAYARLGEFGKEAETIQELFTWIKTQETYSDNEIAGLQLALLSNLDGIYTDMYSSVLCNAFLKEPAVFVECLNYDPDNVENSNNVVMLTVYGAAVSDEILEEVKATLRELIECDALTGGAVPWAELMLRRCDDPYGETG